MENKKLSQREQELLDLIIIRTEGVTVSFIEAKLSPKHLGALGRLIGRKLIKSTKERQGEQKYGAKYVKIYKLTEPEKPVKPKALEVEEGFTAEETKQREENK